MISIKDISLACNVSTATVSKALNGAHDISEATKERICRAASEMGYLPNAAARSLKTNRTNNIGVLFKEEAGSGLTHEYFAAVLESFKNKAESKGFDITFINTNNDTMSYYEHCIYRNVDGVAVVCANFKDPQVAELVNSDIPAVTIDYVFNSRMAVMSDNVKGMSTLVEYVYKMGHRRIAYIHGAPSSVTDKRLVGFFKTIESLGLEIPDNYVRQSIYHDPENCAKITRELLKLQRPPTCILFPDDFSAVGGYNEIKQLGLKIGEDISVAGYDGINLSQVMEPPMTTIHQKTSEMGCQAASLLIEMIEHPRTTYPEISIIEGDLWEGRSVGNINK